MSGPRGRKAEGALTPAMLARCSSMENGTGEEEPFDPATLAVFRLEPPSNACGTPQCSTGAIRLAGLRPGTTGVSNGVSIESNEFSRDLMVGM
jgi:hypothetical protein